jgi:hypothetical protein
MAVSASLAHWDGPLHSTIGQSVDLYGLRLRHLSAYPTANGCSTEAAESCEADRYPSEVTDGPIHDSILLPIDKTLADWENDRNGQN